MFGWNREHPIMNQPLKTTSPGLGGKSIDTGESCLLLWSFSLPLSSTFGHYLPLRAQGHLTPGGIALPGKGSQAVWVRVNPVAYSSRSTSSPGPQVLPLWWLENGRREKNPKENHEGGRRVSTYDYSTSLLHWYWPITDLLQVVGWGVLYLSKRIVGAICSVTYLFIQQTFLSDYMHQAPLQILWIWW